VTEAAIVLHDVAKRIGKAVVLDAIEATVPEGQLTGLVGPAGAGKTTLLRLIAGLLRSDRGRVEVLGHDAATEAASVQAIVGYLPQRCGFHERLTVGESLKLHADLHGLTGESRRARIEELVGLLDLAPVRERRIRALSGDLQRKVGLACALAGQPRLLLLDEPNAGRSPTLQQELLRAVRGLTAQGTAVLWSTAAFEEAEECAHALLLCEGRLIGQGPPADLATPLAGCARAVAANGAERRRVAAGLWSTPGVLDVQVQASGVRFLADDAGQGDAVLPRLEDCFIRHLIGKSAPAPLPASSPASAKTGGARIDVRGLTKRFGDVVAVSGIDLQVAAGEIVGLVGPAGAGKSVILQILGGLTAPSAGEARIGDVAVYRAPSSLRARLGYMSQKFSLYGELSVAQNLRFFAELYDVGHRRRGELIEQLLAELGLAVLASVRAQDLGASARQRLAFAATLVHEPAIVLLDEPTAGVDPPTRRDLWHRIDVLAQEGAAILVATRSMTEAEACDRLLLLKDGRPLAQGSPDELMTVAAGTGNPEPSLEAAFLTLVDGTPFVGAGR
jgi:ABC-2 type transport system ATP-binding protein